MPDHENTFVLKASNNMEFVIEAHDTDDMRSWLATIRYCMRSGIGGDHNLSIIKTIIVMCRIYLQDILQAGEETDFH